MKLKEIFEKLDNLEGNSYRLSSKDRMEKISLIIPSIEE